MLSYRINVHEDLLGTGIYYTRPDTGYILNKHEYDAWGYNTKAPSYNYDPEYRVSEPYFTGHPYDGALNLYYAHNRFYDSQTGQWLSEDPVKSGLNWYRYCGGNPISCVDVLGLEKAYIVIQEEFMINARWSDEEYKNYEDDLVHQVKATKRYEDTDIEVIYVTGKEDFIEAWNTQMDVNPDFVLFSMHSDPSGMLFIHADEEDDEGKTPITYETLTAKEILEQMDYKEVGLMINLGCNSGGYVEKKEITEDTIEYKTPYVEVFQQKGIESQVVAKGFVQVPWPKKSTYEYEGIVPVKFTPTKEQNRNWLENILI